MKGKKNGRCECNSPGTIMMEEKAYVRHYAELVEKEREEVMRMHEEEMGKLSGKEREAKGRAFLKMKGKYSGLGLGGKHLVKFTKQFSQALRESEIEVGDLVLVSREEQKSNLPSNDNPTGTVAEKTSYSITVAFDENPPGFVFHKNLRIDLFVNDVTFQRMLEALKRFEKLPQRRKEILLGKRAPNFGELAKEEDIEFFNAELNESEKKAVVRSLAANDFTLIHGPPGTGKTITCVEVITQLVKRRFKVLATADSNVAVDNLVEHLDEIGVKIVRVGHPARVIPALRRISLDYLIQDVPEFIKAQEFREKGFELKEKQNRFNMPEMRWRRGLNDAAIAKLAREGKTTRGIPQHKIEGMKKWLDLKEEIDKLFGAARELEEKAIRKIISEADVVCSTNSTAGSELLQNYASHQQFDFVVIDEATQSTEPSSLIAVVQAKRFIMAGDHKQLPPTILNEDAGREGLGKSLFERLLEMHSDKGKNKNKNEDKIMTMLEIQYRMNREIAEFPNKEFYGGKLRTAACVKNQTLEEFSGEPLLFIDTSGSDGSGSDSRGMFKERTRKGSTSKDNRGEAELVKQIAERLLNRGVKSEDIGIISPYEDQRSIIRGKLGVEGLEIKTVDGFQGREKEVIIVSFVRSNESGEIGFLKDLRRLNVAITRAKRKLVLIGDSETLTHERGGEAGECYKRLIDLAKERGGYKKLVNAHNLNLVHPNFL